MIKKNYAAFRKLRPLKDFYSFDSAKCDPTRGSGSTCRALFAHSTSTPILRKSPGSCAARCAASSQDVLQKDNEHIISRRPKFVQIDRPSRYCGSMLRVQSRYNRQRTYLEKSVDSLKRKLAKDSEARPIPTECIGNPAISISQLEVQARFESGRL